MQRLPFSLLLFLFAFSPVLAQPFDGGITLGGSQADRLLALATTSTRYYAVGSFRGTWSPDTAHGGSDAYLIAFDSQLQPLWRQTWGGPSDDECTHIAAHDSALYTATFFWDSITIDTLTLRAPGSALAILRWTPAGRIQWAHLLTGNGIKAITGLSANGRFVRAIGYFSDSLSANGGGHLARGMSDAFALTLDTAGTPLGWQQWGNTGQTRAWALAAETNPTGEWYMAVGFDGEAAFGDSLLISGARDWDAVLLAHDSTGQLQWLQELAGVGDVRTSGLAYQSGRVWLAGHYINSLAIGGQFYVTASNDFDLFAGAFEAGSGQWLRSTTWGGPDDELSQALHVLPHSLTLGGYYFGDAQLGSATLLGDAFVPLGYVLSADTLLQWQSAVSVGDLGAEVEVAAFAERPDRTALALGGTFTQSIAMTPQLPLLSSGSSDGFLLTYPTEQLTRVHAPQLAQRRFFPLPMGDNLHWEAGIPLDVLECYDLQGRLLRRWLQPTAPLFLGDWPAGSYVLRWVDRAGATGTQLCVKMAP